MRRNRWKCLEWATAFLVSSAWAAEERLVSGFVDDMPAIEQTRSMTLMFEHLWPMPEGRTANVAVTWRWMDGVWTSPAEPVMSDGHYGQRVHAAVRESELRLTNGVLVGRTVLAFEPPRDKTKTRAEEVCAIELECRVREGEHAPHIPDRLPALPPWKKSWRPFGGTLIAGEYSATLRKGTDNAAVVKGRVAGGINPVPVADRWGAAGNGAIRKAPGGGMRFLARLSPKRVMPPEEAFAELPFAEARDWREYQGLRLRVVAPARRDDAAVAVRIREASGAAGMLDTSRSNGVWYSVASAAFLRDAETVFDVPFQDFRGRGDASCGLSLDRIAALAVGVDNPTGVGDVEFTVRRIELYGSGDGRQAAAKRPVDVAVDPSRRLSLNGHSAVPSGMFGVHDTGGGGVWWMKRGPLEPEKEAYLRQIRPGFFRAANAYPPEAHTATVRQAGTPLSAMGCHHLWTWSRPEVYDAVLDGRFDSFLDGFRRAYDAMAADSKFAGLSSDDRPSMEVSNESFMWGRYANQGHFTPAGKKDFADPAQYGYLSGPRTAEVYSKMFLAAWEGANGKDKRLRLAGPCSSEFHNDDFAHFRDYVAPFIDRCFGKVDILTEHHYGGWPLAAAASWEVAKTYCVVKHGGTIPIANTETTEIVWSAGLRGWYNLGDILECLRVCPDVAHARSIHALWGGHMGNAGETAVLTLLNALRGTRVPVRASDPSLLHAAAWTPERELVLVAFNPGATGRRLRLASPAGCTLKEMLRLRLAASAASEARDAVEDLPLYPVYDPAECKIERVALPAGVAGGGACEFDLPPTTALRWVWARAEGAGGPTGAVEVVQGFWKEMFVRLKPGETATGGIVWPKPAGRGRNVVLRVITRDVHAGEGKAVVNGQEVPLPWSSSNDGYCTVQDLPLESGWLSPDTTLSFVCAPGERANGFTVYAASVLADAAGG
jgi:hypothetical protein